MESLFAKADAIRPLKKRRKTDKDDHRPKPKTSASTEESNDLTLFSITQNSGVPKSLRPSSPTPESALTYTHVKDKKLRTHLTRESIHSARSKRLVKDAELLLPEEKGKMQVEGDMEKTWRIGQDEIVQAAGQEAARGRREWKLDGGPYRSRYTRNGRQVLFIRSRVLKISKSFLHVFTFYFVGSLADLSGLQTFGHCWFIGACSYVRLADWYDAFGATASRSM